jgi:hypothetical protein
MNTHQIVCLANSYKHNHRCMAGIGLTTKQWVRLIGRDVQGCLTREQTCYRDGKEAAVLDLFEAELGEQCGSKSHPEDVYVTGKPWRLIRRFDEQSDLECLSKHISRGPFLLEGFDDRVSVAKAIAVPRKRSLELIEPEDLWWWIREDKGKRRNRALFRVSHEKRVRYDLAVTDPAWLNQLNLLPAGIYPHALFFKNKPPRTYLTVSLSEPFEGFHYKLVAGVVPLPG